jgi:amino acid transporter
MTDPAEGTQPAPLARELRLWEAVALSVGIMAPTLAVSLNGTLPASLVGTNVPAVFLLAFAGVGLVAYGFVRLTRLFSHAGSVYALAGATIGPRAGFFAGWALLGVYITFAVATTAGTALFLVEFLEDSGIWSGAPWFPIALVALVVVWLLAGRDVRVISRALISMEGISVLLIVALIAVIFGRIIVGEAPDGQTFALGTLVPDGVSVDAVLSASVFGFLSWAGFEGAAALGEETSEPRRNIPRAILYAVVVTGVFYVVSMFAETIGFGANTAGAEAFAGSGAPIADLAKMYVGTALATALSLGAAMSAFASALGSAAASGRVLFALSRDGFGPPALARVSPRTAAPEVAIGSIMTLALVIICVLAATGTSSLDAYFWLATIGVLCLIVAYLVTTVGAMLFLFVRARVRTPLWQLVFPLLGAIYLVFVLYKQIYPVPDHPYNLFPYIAGAWSLLGLAVVVGRPALARRIGERLTSELGTVEAPQAARA